MSQKSNKHVNRNNATEDKLKVVIKWTYAPFNLL